MYSDYYYGNGKDTQYKVIFWIDDNFIIERIYEVCYNRAVQIKHDYA